MGADCLDVYGTAGGGFGDCWAAASYLLTISTQVGKPTRVAQLDDRIRQILPHLDSAGSLVEVPEGIDILIASSFDAEHFSDINNYYPKRVLEWAVPLGVQYCMTTKRWECNASGKVCCQLYPRRLGDTSCANGHVKLFMEALHSRGYRVIEIGAEIGLAQSIEEASTSEYFVGVDSGMSHVAHSVGLPVHIIRNRLPRHHLYTTHRGKRYSSYRDIPDFLDRTGMHERNHTST